MIEQPDFVIASSDIAVVMQADNNAVRLKDKPVKGSPPPRNLVRPQPRLPHAPSQYL